MINPRRKALRHCMQQLIELRDAINELQNAEQGQLDKMEGQPWAAVDTRACEAAISELAQAWGYIDEACDCIRRATA